MLTPGRLTPINSPDKGLDQKVRGQDRVLLTHPTQTLSHRRRGEP